MAEFMLRDMAETCGLGAHIAVESAATSTEEIGSPVDSRAAEMLRMAGIDCAEKRARQMQKEDYAAYDYLVGMDRMNTAMMRRIAGGDPDGKICRLLDFATNPRDIADPWYTGDFDAAFDDVRTGCKALLKRIEERRMELPATVNVFHVQTH